MLHVDGVRLVERVSPAAGAFLHVEYYDLRSTYIVYEAFTFPKGARFPNYDSRTVGSPFSRTVSHWRAQCST